MSTRKQELEERLNDTIDKVVRATILVTTIVYLRPHCKGCVYRDLGIELQQHITGNLLHLLDDAEGIPQFMRQVVIFTKEFAEKWLQETACEEAITSEAGECQLVIAVMGEST